MKPPQLQAKAVQAIRKAVAKEAAPFDITDLQVTIGPDADGEETIFVDIWHPLRDHPVETRMLLKVRVAVLDALLKIGEQRFPLVRQHFAERQIFGTAA